MANNNHFELTLDTLAPSGSISRGDDRYHNDNFALTIDKGDASFMKVWRNAEVNGTKSDTEYPTTWEAAATSKDTDFSASVENYYHLVLMDSVGNESDVYNTDLITFDNVVPVVAAGSFYLEDKDSGLRTFTNDKEVKYGFNFSDDLTGVKSYTISGDCETVTSTDIPSDGKIVDRLLKLTTGDGEKVLTVTVTDSAGNESVAVEASIILDTALDKPVMALYATKAIADESGSLIHNFINYHTIGLGLTVEYEAAGIAYKIWEDGAVEPETWTQFTAAEKVKIGDKDYFRHVAEITLSANDGLKTMHAKVMDAAMTVMAADDKSVTIDTVKPVISLTRTGAEWISDKEGFKTSELTFSLDDVSAGIKNYVLDCNGSSIVTGKTAETDATKTVTSAITGMVEGTNTFTLTVYDDAVDATGAHTNVSTATAVVKLDRIAPTPVSITALNTWYKDKFTIQANTSDGAGIGVKEIYAYTSIEPNDENCPAAAKPVARTADAQTIAIADITWALAESANNYMHIKVVDKVGNISYAHAKFGFDSVKPFDNGSKFAKAYYNAVSASLDVAYGDDTSAVAYMKVTGTDIDDPDTDFVAAAATRAVTLNGEDGIKKVTIQFKDNAGNLSEPKELTTELDRSKPVGEITLHVEGSDDAKPSVSNIATFDAWIAYTDDSIQPETMLYQYYGTGIGTTYSAEGPWNNFAPTAGKKIGEHDAMVLATSTCTTGDGLKEVYVRFKDGAGNISDQVKASFTYDTTAPEPEAKGVDFNRVSKVHIERQGSEKFCDEIHFTLDPHCTMQAYKVCAYADENAAKAGSHADDAKVIPTTAGSENMSGSALHTSATVACMIRGADYETALGTAGDGLHYVVVYVQDEGGNWSVAANFEA